MNLALPRQVVLKKIFEKGGRRTDDDHGRLKTDGRQIMAILHCSKYLNEHLMNFHRRVSNASPSTDHLLAMEFPINLPIT